MTMNDTKPDVTSICTGTVVKIRGGVVDVRFDEGSSVSVDELLYVGEIRCR